MSNKKYVSLSKLSTFLENLKDTFSGVAHTHTTSDITDYIIDDELSSDSTNPVQNKVIDAEFNAMSDAMGALEYAIDNLVTPITSAELGQIFDGTYRDAWY